MLAKCFKPAVGPKNSKAAHALSDGQPRSRLFSCSPSGSVKRLLPKMPFRSRREQRADHGDLVPGKQMDNNGKSHDTARSPGSAVHPQQLTLPKEEGFLEEYVESLLIPEGLPPLLRDEPVLVPNPLYNEAESPDEDEKPVCSHPAVLAAQTSCSRTVEADHQVQLQVIQATVVAL